MAHRTNIVQVKEKVEPDNPSEVATDPICGMQMERIRFRHVLFRDDATYYFCSKHCETEFIKREKKAA